MPCGQMPRRLRRWRPTAHASAPSSFRASQCEAGTTLWGQAGRALRLSGSSPRRAGWLAARRTVGVIARRPAFRPRPKSTARALDPIHRPRQSRHAALSPLPAGGSQRLIGMWARYGQFTQCASSCAMRRGTVDWLVLALVYDLVACTHSSLKMAVLKHAPGQLVAPLPHPISLNKMKLHS